MTRTLDRLAALAGMESEYFAFSGERVTASDEVKRAILAALRLPAQDEADMAEAAGTIVPVARDPLEAPAGVRCHMPDWLADGRAWGIACQIYSLVSDRNAGIGDFEDLARLAELGGAAGADFLGVSPLHAPLLAAPERCSPFFPSNRRFLNPLFIALDMVPGFRPDDMPAPHAGGRCKGERIDYPAVAALKRDVLKALFRRFRAQTDEDDQAAFTVFVAEEGEALRRHALFEAISEDMVRTGGAATWHGWPEDFRSPDSPAVLDFEAEHAELVAFHAWLQWIADAQLAAAQARAKRAGMRIGLYLDLAVGVASDGSATWSDRSLTVNGASIGAPPDYFDTRGQDWGLAPVSPLALAAEGGEPYREAIDAAIRHAGALRIDHAMSLHRLFWVPWGRPPVEGAYLRYPLHTMLRALAAASNDRQAIIIGEDLGLVPEGFREMMRQMEIQGYRVFHFEREGEAYLQPARYPREALACITTHDLPTLAGWWTGADIAARREAGIIDEETARTMSEERHRDRHRMVWALGEAGLVPRGFALGDTEGPQTAELPQPVAEALHRLVARAPSRLFAAALEDMVGSTRQVNMPGTSEEYPNWRGRLPVAIEALAQHPRFRALAAALAEERPRL